MSKVALIGLPNSGKSSIFNLITGNKQRIANFPGITVEKRTGSRIIDSEKFEFLDLPGIYTLDTSTLDEKVTRDYIFDKSTDRNTDLVVLVLDATNLKKSLYLGLQLKEIGQKFVIALNMSDIARSRGQKLNLQKLSDVLGGVKVIETSASTNEGIDSLLSIVKEVAAEEKKELTVDKNYQLKIKQTEYIKQKLNQVDVILKAVVNREISKDNLTEKLDSIVLHPVWGPSILFGVLLLIFQLLFAWSDPFMGIIESAFNMLASVTNNFLDDGLLKSLIVDGIIAGVGGILVFLPHIIFLFIIIYTLEDFGYLGRAAFLLDFIMRKVGLPGKSVVPLLSSHACAIPGIMSARIIENPFQRLITMMISPLTTCSARLPVYTLLIAVIVPDTKLFGIIGLPGLALLCLYLFGILSAFIVALIAKKAFVPTSPSYLMMELPSYRVPQFKNVLRGALAKGWIFTRKAGTVILLLSIIIWGLVTFPSAPANKDKPDIHYSYAASIGKVFEPIFRPLGFDWKITTALIPSFAAREVLVSAMGTVYSVSGDDTEDKKFLKDLSDILKKEYSLGTLLALLVWFVFSPQCIATFGVLKKETNGYKMPIIFGTYTLIMAYFFSYITFLVFS